MFAETALRAEPKHRLRLDKGSHIVVRRLYDYDRAYILQRRQPRVFAIPFQRDFTQLIGRPIVAGDPSTVLPTGEEIDYLCGVVNEYSAPRSARPMWCGLSPASVRSTTDRARKPQDIGRDYALKLDERFGEAPLAARSRRTGVSREDALARTGAFLSALTARSPLPGGDFVYDGVDTLIERTQRTWRFLTADRAAARPRLRHAGRARARRGDCARRSRHAVAPICTAAEAYLMSKEWAQTADDVRARSKLGLRLTPEQAAIPRSLHGVGAVGKAVPVRKILSIERTEILSICGRIMPAMCRFTGRHELPRNADRMAGQEAQSARHRRRAL